MHRFVEPPRLGRAVVALAVSTWEIECCAPPPTVGERTSWQVSVAPRPDDPPWPGRAEHSVRAQDGDGRVLVDDAVVAHWFEELHGPRPVSGRVWAELYGTVHGGSVPDDLPALEGRVERVRVVRVEYRITERDRRPVLEPVPGTMTLTDVRSAPRRFAWAGPDGGVAESDVLIDVQVPAASVPAPPPSS